MEKYVAVYLRLSDDDEDIGEEKKESQSIENQRELINYYLKNHAEIQEYPIREFVDDGYSGVSFERPGIQKLLREVREQHVACIIVKDFSRFGRNYIETGDYIEQIFPFLGVRFISVSDNYDSNLNQTGIEVGLKNLLHDLYSKDLSKKIKAVKQLYQKQGRYTGGDVPYGYRRNMEEGPMYIPDPEAAKVVQRIFKLAAMGKKVGEIADILTEEKVPTRGSYKNQRDLCKYNVGNPKKNFWMNSEVKEIIENPVYIGTYVCSKSTNIEPRVQKKKDKSEFLLFENAHDPLIDKEIFQAAQMILPSSKKHKKIKKHSYLLKGKVQCGYCGYSMTKSRSKNPSFSCRMGNRCGSHLSIKAKVLEETVLKIIQKYIRVSVGYEEEQITANQIKEKLQETREKKKILEMKKGNCKSGRIYSYKQWREGQLSQKEYLDKKERYIDEERRYDEELEEIDEKIEKLMFWGGEEEGTGEDQGLLVKELTEELVDKFIEKIYVYGKDRIEIQWKIQDIFNG